MKTFTIFMALSGYERNLSDFRGWYFNSYNLNMRSPDALYLFPSRSIDKSLCPADIQTLQCFCEFPYETQSNKKALKKEMQLKVLSRLEGILGKFRDHVIFVDSATPSTMERYTLNKGGSAYGWEMSPEQTGAGRLQQVTPIKNLFLVGHWTIPGSGITAVSVSGWQLAKNLLNI